jgi:hypothetical protein
MVTDNQATASIAKDGFLYEAASPRKITAHFTGEGGTFGSGYIQWEPMRPYATPAQLR